MRKGTPLGPLAVRVSTHAYTVLLLLYPAEFRRRHSQQMAILFRDRSEEVLRALGHGGLLAFWGPALRDVLVNGSAERLRAIHTFFEHSNTPRGFEHKLDRQRGGGMDSIIKDVRYAIRTLLKHPAFSTVAIVTIGLGIGANTAIFSVVEAVLLRPLPYDQPDRLVVVWAELQNRNMDNWPHSPINFRDYQEQSELFEDFAGVFTFSQPMTGEGDPVQIEVGGVTHNFFSMLGVSPAMGRDFTAEDVIPPPPPDPNAPVGTTTQPPPSMVILSDGFWRRTFGADPDVLGTTVELGGGSAIVVGVLPAGFQLLMSPVAGVSSSVDLWTAARIDFEGGNPNNVFLRVIGRLKDGVSTEQAQAEMSAIATRLSEENQIKQTAGFALDVVPMHQELTAEIRPVVMALAGAVLFVLLIACANVSNLLLVRASAREKEIAVRAAMGGSRTRLIRQMMAESLVLGLLGGVLGLILAQGGIEMLLALQPEDLPRIDAVAIDNTVLGFTAGASVLAALVFGILPAISASKPQLAESLRDRSRSSGAAMNQFLRNGVVITEVALSLVLLIGAGLMVRSFVELTRVDPGYDAESVLTFSTNLPPARYPTVQDRSLFKAQIQERLGAIPGVTHVSGATPLPLTGGFPLAGRYGPEEALEDETLYGQADYRIVLPGYFETLRTNVIAGRTFTPGDNADSLAYVVVDQKLAAAVWPGQNPVGRTLMIRITTPEAVAVEVIGVVEHQRHPSVASEGRETVYFTDRYVGSFGIMTWALRTGVEPTSIAPQVRAAVAELDPLIPLYELEPYEAVVDRSMAQTRFALVLISVFGVIALAMASVGLYGVLSYVVRQRTGEIGIRMAFGAERGTILGMVVRQGLGLAAIGVGVGVVAAFGVTRVMESMLIGVTATDPFTFASISVLFLLVAGAASLIPALRATRVDPVVALREE